MEEKQSGNAAIQVTVSQSTLINQNLERLSPPYYKKQEATKRETLKTRKKCYKLDYTKYLKSRSYELFKSAIRSDRSLDKHRNELWHFCDYAKMSTEEIIGRYEGENTKDVMQLQRIIEDYIMQIQIRIRKNEIKSATAHIAIPSIKLFCEMNDIILNWKKISRLLPRPENNATDGAYNREQIKKNIGKCYWKRPKQF